MTLQSIIQVILKSMIDPLVPILFGLAILIFAWGLFKYLRAGIGDKEIEGAKSLMFWGVIIVFVMVSVWGLVIVIQNIFFGGESSTTFTTDDINKFDLIK